MKAAATAIALASLTLAVPTAIAADATSLGVGYICGAEQRPAASSAPTVAVMLQGVGNGASPADTRSHEAQVWYDEGLNLYHSFNHNEASAALAKAAALDPACALCQWGVALSLGPTLNYGVTPAQTALALAAADKAAGLVRPDDARAKALIATLQLRYGKATPEAKRETLYGHAMEDLFQRYPADNEIAALTVQALLTPARHDDFAGVPRAVEILKTVLARAPNDTAAIHYYIHATEFAGRPADALPYAEKLAALTPGASHMVHMAAHTLMHVGEYERVAIINAQAMKVDADVESRLAYPGPLSAQIYYLHNYTFGLDGALMAGDAKLAVKYADHASIAFPANDKTPVAAPAGSLRPGNSGPDRRTTATARALVAYGRYDPARALALPDNPADPRISRIYLHYARGEAFAARGDAAAVAREADALAAFKAEATKAGDLNSIVIAGIASDVLAGRAALLSNQPGKAAEAFARAAASQEKTFPFAQNFDPPPWWYPVRRSLAAADLAAGKPADAMREAKASLKDWPQDALALKVLSEAEAKTGDAKSAKAHLAEAQRDWRGDLAKVPLNLS
jgi:tetratricopeptide (TPR) repeat protein